MMTVSARLARPLPALPALRALRTLGAAAGALFTTFTLFILLLSFSLMSVDVARAQESRATAIAQQQAKKARELKENPLPKPKSRRLRSALPRIAPLEEAVDYLIDPRGFYPLVGSVYSGGGFSAGAGYRWFYGDDTAFDLKGLYSIRNYKWVELSASSPGATPRRPTFRGRAGWRDATQVAFYGLGPETSVDDRSNFRLQNLYAGGDVSVAPVFPFVLFGGVTYENYTTKEGQGNQPSIETEWQPSQVPGLGADPVMIHSVASGAIDWRPADGYARTGGLYEVRFHNYHDLDDVHSFNRLEGDVVQHIPLIREKYVISLHGRVETVLGNDAAPFFLLPSLGSGSTLRAYSSWRFRDRHSMLLQAEWRWIPNRRGMDVAVFYDAGKVVPLRDDLDFDGLTSNIGIGFRFHGPSQTPIRVEVAHGDEGLNLVFAGSAAF